MYRSLEVSFSRVLSQLRSRIPARFPEHRQLPRYLDLPSWVGSECLRPPEPQDAFPTWPGLWGACTPGGLCALGPPQRSSWTSDAEAQAARRDPEDLGVPVSACQTGCPGGTAQIWGGQERRTTPTPFCKSC